jgi:hypothetical protein
MRVIPLAGQRDERAGIDEQQIHARPCLRAMAPRTVLALSPGRPRAQRADETGFAGNLVSGLFRLTAAKRLSSKLDDHFRLAAPGFHAIARQRLFETLGNANGGGHGLARSNVY